MEIQLRETKGSIFSSIVKALALLVGQKEGHPAWKKLAVGVGGLTGALHVL